MVDFALGNLVDGNIYHRVWNRETRPTMFSELEKVAEGGWAGVAPLDCVFFMSFSQPCWLLPAGGASRWMAGVVRHCSRS